MHSAGKREARNPDRYNPSEPYPPPILPSTDFDITMSESEENRSSLPRVDPLDDTSHPIYAYLKLMNDTINQKFETLEQKIDNALLDSQTQIKTLKAEFHRDIVGVLDDISGLQQQLGVTNTSLAENINKTSHVKASLQSEVKKLSERVCLVEGQSSRLSAVENTLQNLSLQNNSHSLPQELPSSNAPQISFQNLLSSTNIAPPHQSISSAPQHVSPVNNMSTFANISGITLDYTKIPTYDGNLFPVHPESFLSKVDQYFSIHPVPDPVRISLISDKLTDKALLWYNTLIPSPQVFDDFSVLFRNHFWSSGRQRSIRNELYRPYSHKDHSTMQDHAMDWINRARYLSPPVDQKEMIDLIISHFSYNISLALRGLRIQTTNELIQQLSYLQITPSHNDHTPQNTNYSNNSSNFNNNNNSRQNATYQNRYQGRNNNQNSNHRSQYNNPPSDPRRTDHQNSPNDDQNSNPIPPLIPPTGNGPRPDL